MKNFLKITFFILPILVLTGCFKSNGEEVIDYQQSQNKQNISTLKERLSKANVYIVQRYGSLALVLQDKDFFIDGSANFTEHALKTLDLIFALASYHQGTVTAVTGYSRKDDNQIDKALAMERARKVANVLWKSGIPANFVYADSKKAHLSSYVLIEFKDFTS